MTDADKDKCIEELETELARAQEDVRDMNPLRRERNEAIERAEKAEADLVRKNTQLAEEVFHHEIEKDYNRDANSYIAELQAERNNLRVTLNDYGDHAPGCYMRNAPNEPRDCNCKWEEKKREVLGCD